MTSPGALATAAHPAAGDEFVLGERQLRPGVALEGTARFRDDRWPLKPALLQQHQKSLVLNFADIPARYRQAAKELCYAMLSGELPAGEPRPAVQTAHTVLAQLKPFLTWLAGRPCAPGMPGGPALTAVSSTDLQDYRRHLTASGASAGSRENKRGAVRYLWRYRESLISDRLSFDPHDADGWLEGRKNSPAENTTDRIPEAVHGPLLAWSLRFISDFAPDILAADQQWHLLHRPGQRLQGSTRTSAREDLRRLLDDYRARGRPLPGHQGRVNLSFVSATLGRSPGQMRRFRDEIDRAAAAAGVSDRSYFDVPVAGNLDGQPWLDGIACHHQLDDGLATLARMLLAAAYTVVAFLSGMRDCELKHLRRGCLSVQRDDTGRPYRWKVTSLAFKGERDPAGVQATWVIGAPAARAIEILQRLQPDDADLLFAPLAHTPGGRTRTATRALTYASTNRQLNEFIRWINDYCAARGRTDDIPLVGKRPWILSTRQFRRTLAWFIARRPGGAVAGAIAYRHQAVCMFEGYAGTSDSGFRAEVESEQALARGEHLLAMIDAHEHHGLAGPAAGEAARRLEEFGDRARFPGTVITDRRRLDRVLKRNDPAIYPGTYATCVHTYATAACGQHRDSRGEIRPDLSGCKPLTCRNVALTPGNIGSLRQEITRIDQELQSRPLPPPLLQHRLGARREDITTFLARHTPDVNHEPRC